MSGWPKVSKGRFPHDFQVKVLTDFSPCAYFWCRVDERGRVKHCKEPKTPGRCVVLWHSLGPIFNICFLTWPRPAQGWGSEQFSSVGGLPFAKVPAGSLWETRSFRRSENKSLFITSITTGSISKRAFPAVLSLPGKQLWPESSSETKINHHQYLSPNDSSHRGYFLIIGFLSNQTWDLTLEQIKPCQD